VKIYGATVELWNESGIISGTSSANSGSILLKAANSIYTGVPVTLKTFGRDIILWANSDNLDTNSSSNGAIMIYGYCAGCNGSKRTIIDSTTGAAIQTNSAYVSGLGTPGQTGGGKIVLGGGLDDGANGGTAGDGVPDGFAWGDSNYSDWSSGVRLSRERGADSIRLLSGGGDIIIRGRASAVTNIGLGVMVFDGVGINSGTGKVDITGVGASWHGIEFAPWDWANRITITSAATNTTAISIVGSTTSTTGDGGVFIGYRSAHGSNTGYTLAATGAGGLDRRLGRGVRGGNCRCALAMAAGGK
jgi:hypothetical protein